MRLVTIAELEPRYDCIFFGTSTINLFEAIHQRAIGNRVLLIDDQPRVGGVWVTLEIFGLHDVENAIHYFLYDARGIAFMREVLGWQVVPTPNKYRVLPRPIIGKRWLRYDNPFSLVAARWFEARLGAPQQRLGLAAGLRTLASAIAEAFKRNGASYYLAGGTPEMMRSVHSLFARHDLDVLLQTEITRLHLDPAQSEALVGMGAAQCRAAKIFITHGSRIRNITCEAGPVSLKEEVYRRPQIHLLLRDSTPAIVLEAIFVADDRIKYVHDITRFTREARELAGKHKLLCIATAHDVRESDDLYEEILKRLKTSGVVDRSATIVSKQWYESFLPALSTAQLESLHGRFSPVLDILKSDNFCQALGIYGPRWAESLAR